MLSDKVEGNILVTGRAVLYIPKGSRIAFAKQDVLRIMKGASLRFYDGSGTDATFDGTLNNENYKASAFVYLGLASAAGSSATFAVPDRFYGAIYAPDEKVVIIGNRSHQSDFYGAVKASDISVVLE